MRFYERPSTGNKVKPHISRDPSLQVFRPFVLSSLGFGGHHTVSSHRVVESQGLHSEQEVMRESDDAK